MTNEDIEPHYWGYEIVKEQLEGGFLDQWLNRQGMPSMLIIKDTTDPERQIPASEFGKEAGLIMIPSWAARPNVGFEMGLTALRRLMTHETIWSHAVQLTQENPLDKQILNAVEELKKYINKIGKERLLEERIDFGLISPYKAQVQYLRQLIKKDAFFKPLRHLITINTVDGFQGQERDVILISLVRANEDGQIGFLNDLRRMNVAITRARMKLIILGDASTLTKHAFYKKLYEYISLC